MYADADVCMGEGGWLARCGQKQTRSGRGGENYQIFADVLMDSP